MSNFGVGFHNLLKQIHYPGLNQYEPYNFDWFVYQPGLEPFLTWIVNNLSEDNFLSEDELNRSVKPISFFLSFRLFRLLDTRY